MSWNLEIVMIHYHLNAEWWWKCQQQCSRTFVATVGAATKHVCDESRDRIQDEQMLRNEISIHKAKKPMCQNAMGWDELQGKFKDFLLSI